MARNEGDNMYLIIVKTFENTLLHFKVKEYLIENNLVCFYDKLGLQKKFPVTNCQIEEIRNDHNGYN